MIPKVRYERRKLADLQPDEKNPREITDEAAQGLGLSIEKWGLVQPLVFNERTGKMVGGHKRRERLLALGETEAEVAVVNLTEAEARALNVALNNPKIQGKFTNTREYLSEVIGGLSLEDFQGLQLDGLMKEPDDVVVFVSEIETSQVQDEFWITARGPLPAQADVLDKLREAIGAIAGVQVKVGTVKR